MRLQVFRPLTGEPEGRPCSERQLVGSPLDQYRDISGRWIAHGTATQAVDPGLVLRAAPAPLGEADRSLPNVTPGGRYGHLRAGGQTRRADVGRRGS